VIEVQSDKDLRRFTRFPWHVYRGHPHWVPPLLLDVETRLSRTKHPFFQHAEAAYFLALRGDAVVGRIAASVDRNHNEFWNEKQGAFGWFECLDDADAARALVQAAHQWVRVRGMKVFRGPLSFSTNDECGLLIEGFDRPPSILMPYNPPYYAALLEACGLTKAKDLWAWEVDPHRPPDERMRRAMEIVVKRKGITLRSLDMTHFAQEVERVKSVYNAAWERNWGFVPMTDAEMDYMAEDLKLGVDPAMILFAEHEGRVVGSMITLPDLNQATRHANGRLLPFGLLKILWHKRRVKSLRVLTLGVLEGYRQRGIEMALIQMAFENAQRRGYDVAEISWTLEDNVRINRPVEAIDAVRTKTYRLYEMPV
jgi:GNAT superfamily N-acetyltransferase